jgi:putative CocE/NonD family hydrolase
MDDQQRWDKINNTYIGNGIAFEKLDSLEGHGTDTVFQRWLKHPAFDNYWQSFTPTKDEFSRINIPILTTTGYFDDDQRGALYYYNMHNRYGPKEAVKNHYLFIGPFDHAGGQGWPRPSIPPYSIDSAALINQEKMVMDWFDFTLKGGKKPEFLKDRISVFAMGENKWHYFNSLHTMNKDSITYYIDHVAANSKDIFLSPIKPNVERTARLLFNTSSVENDTMHVFTNNNAMVTEVVFRRKDALIIKTAALEEDIMLNGSISADLFIASSAFDADILLTWWEEDASGKLWPLSCAMQRLSHARDVTKKMTLKKNNIYHIKSKNGFWISRRLPKGSKLVMTISPLTDRFWQKNYGGAGDVSKQTKKDAGVIALTIYAGKNFSSRIKLPVMK